MGFCDPSMGLNYPESLRRSPTMLLVVLAAQDTLQSSREGRVKREEWSGPMWAGLTGHH